MDIRISRRFSAVPEFYALIPFGQSQTYVVAEDHSMTKVARCVSTPHSLSATTTTLLLDAGVGIIIDVRDCLPLDLAPFQSQLLEGTGRDVVRIDGQRAKLLCRSGFREQGGTLRRFVGFCPNTTMTAIAAHQGHARGWDQWWAPG